MNARTVWVGSWLGNRVDLEDSNRCWEAVLANNLNCGTPVGGHSGKLASVAAAQRKGSVYRVSSLVDCQVN